MINALNHHDKFKAQTTTTTIKNLSMNILHGIIITLKKLKLRYVKK